MVRIIITKRPGEYKIRSYGHAGGGPAGTDIICAGVSTLMQALCQTLIYAEEERKTELHYEIMEGRGAKMEIYAIPEPRNEDEIRNYFRVAITGLQMLEEIYPNNVKIKEE